MTSVSSRPRALRQPLVAAIIVTDIDSEQQISSHTSDLSVHGSFVPTSTPLSPDTRVRIAIIHAGAKVAAFGRVVAARANGMSIAFTKIEQHDQAILEQWLSKLRVREQD